METYGFKKLSIRKLKDDLTPDTTAAIYELDGTKKEGGPTSFDLTGLTKEATKVFAGDVEYFISRKGTGDVAANFGLLDVPAKIESDILGFISMGDNIDGFGEETEAPYVAVVAESEDLYGVPVAFALVAGSFSRDGFSLATKNDEDFTPEAGEYVYTSMSRSVTIGSNTKMLKVLRASTETGVAKLKEAVLGTDVGE